MLQELFKKTRYATVPYAKRVKSELNESPPDELCISCPKCSKSIPEEPYKAAGKVCPLCGHHARIGVFERLALTVDAGSFTQLYDDVQPADPLDFPGYKERVSRLQTETRLSEAVVCGSAEIDGNKCMLSIMDSSFLMGSMGAVVGERLARLFEEGVRRRLPVVVFTASGGARMHEGIFSLMQMAKVSAAVGRHSNAGLLYVTVLTDPTTGGVTASFAMLGDIIISEPGATIGFAGRRVIEGTIRQKLPEDFQTAEFQRDCGFVDAIVHRNEMRASLARILRLHCKADSVTPGKKPVRLLSSHDRKWSGIESLTHTHDKNRPVLSDYIEKVFDGLFELHGDRMFGDDCSVWGGIGTIGGRAVTVIGHVKGKNTKENIKTNFAMPHPEGYRKALRLMKQAAKFGRPVICFIDTPGAFCGIEAEKRGQGEAIARCLMDMMTLPVPTISIVTGEGGSGGALAFGVSSEVYMMENAIYAVISPRGCANILWKDPKRENEAANMLKITAGDLKKFGVVDGIIPEPSGGANRNKSLTQLTDAIRAILLDSLTRLCAKTSDEILELRYNKFRSLGITETADFD